MSLSPSSTGNLIFGLLMSGISSCLTSLNFWTTILLLRSYCLTLKTMPLFPWALLITGGIYIFFHIFSLSIFCSSLHKSFVGNYFPLEFLFILLSHPRLAQSADSQRISVRPRYFSLERLVFWNSIHQEVASDSFCFLINSSWLLVFILYVFSLF
jgi:hypothetical protein